MPKKIFAYAGLAQPERGLTGPAILSLLIDRALDGDDDPVPILELCNAAAESYEAVVDELENLIEDGSLRIEGVRLRDVGSVVVQGITIHLSGDQRALDIAAKRSNKREIKSVEPEPAQAVAGETYEAEYKESSVDCSLTVWVCKNGMRDRIIAIADHPTRDVAEAAFAHFVETGELV